MKQKLIRDVNGNFYRLTQMAIHEIDPDGETYYGVDWVRKVSRTDIRKALKEPTVRTGCTYRSGNNYPTGMFFVTKHKRGKTVTVIIGCKEFKNAAAKAILSWAKSGLK